MSSDAPAVVFDGVGKAFPSPGGGRYRSAIPGHRGEPKPGDLEVLRDITLTIPKGQAVGIIGPNGAGKTTLLRLLAGIIRPTRGTVSHDGRLASVIELGGVVHPELTGSENLVMLSATVGGTKPTILSRLADMEEFTGLGDALALPTREYSTGMRARLAFAVTTHCGADILAIDEALSVGDHDFQERCIDQLLGHVERGGTMLAVSHDMWVLARLADRCIWLDEGRVLGDGPAHDVIGAYLDSTEDQIAPSDRSLGRLVLGSDRQVVSAAEGFQLHAAVDLEAPASRLEAEIVFSASPFGPFARARSKIDGGALEPGRYTVDGEVRLPMFMGQVDIGATLTLLAPEGVVAGDGIPLEMRGTSARRPMLDLRLDWTFTQLDAPKVEATIGGSGELPIVAGRGLTKKYLRGMRPWKRLAGVGRVEDDEWTVALDDLTFEVSPASTVGLIGPNGSGKSTLFKVLSNVTKADAGTIDIGGSMVSLIELGIGFHQDLDGWENLRLAWPILGLRQSLLTEQLDAIVEFSGLEGRMDEPIHRWSTGMQARLALSAALHSGADILLMDEVLSVGDQEFREDALQRVKELARQGTAVVLISHNLDLIRRSCERIIRIEDGRVVIDGPADDVVAAIGGLDWEGALSNKPAPVRVVDLHLTPSVADLDEPLKVSMVVETVAPVSRHRLELCLGEVLHSEVERTGQTAEIYDRAMAVERLDLPDEVLAGPGRWSVTCELPPLPLFPTTVDIIGIVVDGDTDEVTSEVRRHLLLGSLAGGRPAEDDNGRQMLRLSSSFQVAAAMAPGNPQGPVS